MEDDMNQAQPSELIKDTALPLDAQCAQMGKLLGLDTPVPMPVLMAALHDKAYAHNLLAARGASVFLKHLIKSPPTAPDIPVGKRQSPSNAKLVKTASKAMWNWARSGFSVVDDDTLQARRSICTACPHLVEGSSSLLHRLAGSGSEADEACGLCGCPVEKKTRMASEQCPSADPDTPGLTRWGDPLDQGE
jgi:hypothetical protein